MLNLAVFGSCLEPCEVRAVVRLFLLLTLGVSGITG